MSVCHFETFINKIKVNGSRVEYIYDKDKVIRKKCVYASQVLISRKKVCRNNIKGR